VRVTPPRSRSHSLTRHQTQDVAEPSRVLGFVAPLWHGPAMVAPDDSPRARPEGAPSSLVPSHQTVRPESEQLTCRNGPPDLRLVSSPSGQVRPVPCSRLRCPPCLHTSAWKRSLAIAYARPERFLTLTQVGNDWQTIRQRIKSFRHQVTKEVGALEWVWNVEPNPRGTGHHVQAWQHGDFLDQAELSRLARYFGMGERVWIERWRSGGEAYALKEAYAVKEVRQAERFLDINGARLTHQSRGFFGGPVREVEQAAVRSKLGPDAEVWTVVTVAELHRAYGRARR
jgi:hypothetical protein